jgi:hypothetical protein
MTSTEAPAASHEKAVEIPEWENAAVNGGANGAKKTNRPGRSFKLDSVLPAHKKYLGMSRKLFLIVLLAIFLAILALIIGLAVGLTHKKYARCTRRQGYW